jgi:hypothetical protein
MAFWSCFLLVGAGLRPRLRERLGLAFQRVAVHEGGMDMSALGKLVLILGLAIAGFGILLLLVGKGLWPHLPGDLSFKLGSVRVFFPLATSIVLSIVLTLVLNLFFRR